MKAKFTIHVTNARDHFLARITLMNMSNPGTRFSNVKYTIFVSTKQPSSGKYFCFYQVSAL